MKKYLFLVVLTLLFSCKKYSYNYITLQVNYLSGTTQNLSIMTVKDNNTFTLNSNHCIINNVDHSEVACEVASFTVIENTKNP